MTAYDTNYLLSSRLASGQRGGKPQVAYKDMTISQIMNDLVESNIGSNASFRRMPNMSEGAILSNYGYNINHYSDNGMAFPYANLLTSLQELAQLTQIPTNVDETLFPVYFDTIATDTDKYVFTQFANQRGLDRRFVQGSDKAILISDTSNQLQDIRLIVDWQEEKTAVTSVFQSYSGTTTKIITDTVIDKTRIANSAFGYREVLMQSPTNQVGAEALKFLREPINYPVYAVYATLQDSPGFLFGIDWGYGDFVSLNAFGTVVDARISAISINISNKAEQISVQLQMSEAYTQ